MLYEVITFGTDSSLSGRAREDPRRAGRVGREARELGSFYQSPATGDSRLQNDVLFTFAIGARLR